MTLRFPTIYQHSHGLFLCFPFPFGSRLAGKMYRESFASGFLVGGSLLSNPSGFPGVALAFPQDKPFLLPAAVACTAIRWPCYKLPPFFCWLPTHHMSSQSDAVLKLAMVGFV